MSYQLYKILLYYNYIILILKIYKFDFYKISIALIFKKIFLKNVIKK